MNFTQLIFSHYIKFIVVFSKKVIILIYFNKSFFKSNLNNFSIIYLFIYINNFKYLFY